MKELYKKLFESKLYTNSFDQFLRDYNSEDGKYDLHSKLKSKELYTDSFTQFQEDYGSVEDQEELGFDLLNPNFQEDTVESADAVSEKIPAQEDTVSASEDTSLESPSGETFEVDKEEDWDFWKQTSCWTKDNMDTENVAPQKRP